METRTPLAHDLDWPVVGGHETAAHGGYAMMQHGHRLRIAALDIDLQQHQVWLHGTSVSFSDTEFRVLAVLVSNLERTLTREEILAEVHGHALVTTPGAVDFQICRIRKKLGSAASFLKTVRGVGYRFAPPAPPAS